VRGTLFVTDQPTLSKRFGCIDRRRPRNTQGKNATSVVAPASMTALTTLGLQSVDIVVADVKLRPGEPHGLALARMIRHQQPSMPIILMTAYPELLEGEALPSPVMTKPVDPSDLCEAIRAALKSPA
jgi:CheY-like chemotaxis protein